MRRKKIMKILIKIQASVSEREIKFKKKIFCLKVCWIRNIRNNLSGNKTRKSDKKIIKIKKKVKI